MRGFPLREMLVLVCGLALLAWPLYRVTVSTGVDTGEMVESEADGVEIQGEKKVAQLTVRVAHVVEKLQVAFVDGSGREESFSFEVEDSESTQEVHYFEISGSYLKVEATWPTGTPETALMIRLEPEGEEAREWNLWGQDQLVEEISL